MSNEKSYSDFADTYFPIGSKFVEADGTFLEAVREQGPFRCIGCFYHDETTNMCMNDKHPICRSISPDGVGVIFVGSQNQNQKEPRMDNAKTEQTMPLTNALIKAWLDGKTLQSKLPGSNIWIDCASSDLLPIQMLISNDTNYDWRLAPNLRHRGKYQAYYNITQRCVILAAEENMSAFAIMPGFVPIGDLITFEVTEEMIAEYRAATEIPAERMGN